MKPLLSVLAVALIAAIVFIDLEARKYSDLEEQHLRAIAKVKNLEDSLKNLKLENTKLVQENTRLEDELSLLKADISQKNKVAGKGKAGKKLSKADSKEHVVEKSGEPARFSAKENAKLLSSIQGYIDNLNYLTVDEFSKREKAKLGHLVANLTMVRQGGQIGLFGIFQGKEVIEPTEELAPWVDALAAVSTQMQIERNHLIEGLTREAPKFSDRSEAQEYMTNERADYFDSHGTAHPGWLTQDTENGGIILIEMTSINSEHMSELEELQEQVEQRIRGGELEVGNIVNKWMPSMPDPESEAGS